MISHSSFGVYWGPRSPLNVEAASPGPLKTSQRGEMQGLIVLVDQVIAPTHAVLDSDFLTKAALRVMAGESVPPTWKNQDLWEILQPLLVWKCNLLRISWCPSHLFWPRSASKGTGWCCQALPPSYPCAPSYPPPQHTHKCMFATSNFTMCRSSAEIRL